MPADTPSIHLDDLTLGYEGHPAVHHLSGSFEPGSMTAIVGPNGAGKSTLLKAIMGRLKPIGGRIRHVGTQDKIAYLPQIADLDRSFPARVFDLVALGLWRRRGLFGTVTRADRQAMETSLEAVGLGSFGYRPIDTLSGGQLQRALFARVLLQDAQVILLDEPFTAIDQKTTRDLIEVIGRWHAEKRMVIAVLHDIELVKQSFPQTLLLAREPIAWGDTAHALSAANMLAARRMTEAWDENAPWHDHGVHA